MANQEQLAILKQGVKVWNEWRNQNPQLRPNLTGENLRFEDLAGVNFSGTTLVGSDLSGADLENASLVEATLMMAHLVGANLAGANLSKAYLHSASLSASNLEQSNFRDATIGRTTFGDVNLSGVRGLETVRHQGPSTIGIDTICISNGALPDAFLQGCGVEVYPKSWTDQQLKVYNTPRGYTWVSIEHSHLNSKPKWCSA